MTKEQQILDNQIRQITEALLASGSAMHPQDFQKLFISMVGNVAGNMTERYWKEFIQVKPCDIPGCDCHIVMKTVVEFLSIMREDHRAFMNKETSITE